MRKINVFASCLVCLLALTLGRTNAVKADHLDQMISPVTHPVIFEDPRHSTELRPIYAYHKIDDKFITEGGDVSLYALQARFQVSDNLSIIAVKDGYIDFNPDKVVAKDTGFANIAAGAKYSFYCDEDSIATAGLTYEIPMGDEEVLQGKGDGMFNPFIAVGHVIDNWNFMMTTGFRLRVDAEDSSFYDLNAHVSYKMENFYPLLEFGLITVMDGGQRLPIPDEGEDLFNFGSTQASGKTIPTLAIGGRYRLADNMDLGAAWQFPLDDGPGTRIIDSRVTADLIYRFSL